MQQFSQSTPFSLRAAALGLVLLSGCQGVITPNAEVTGSMLGFQIRNLDNAQWHDCTVILNRDAGDENRFTHHIGNVEPGATERILVTAFSKKNGERFIPVISKARTLDIQCRMPFLPYSMDLDKK